MVSMVPIAVSELVTIFCPRNGKFSFFNSPYPMHYLFAGLDIYPKRGFGEIAPSPIEGKVIKIRKVKCPKRKDFKAAEFDFVMLLQSLSNPERIVKILHVDPLIKSNEVVEPGQPLGRLLRSGYFNFWTDPHIHLEVRKPSDPLRARGGYTLFRLMNVEETSLITDLNGTVINSKPEYSTFVLKERLRNGLPVDVGGSIGLLDGGIPHYGWFGVHMKEPLSKKSPVTLCGKTIAGIKTTLGDIGLAECSNFSLKVEEVTVGLSLCLSPNSDEFEVKIMPFKMGTLELEESSEVSIDIRCARAAR